MPRKLMMLTLAVLVGLAAAAAAEPLMTPIDPASKNIVSVTARTMAMSQLAEGDVYEIDIPSSGAADSAAAPAPWPVCANGHWLNGPRKCKREHVDKVTHFRPCGKIQIGGRWYHIVYILWYEGGVIIGVTPTGDVEPDPTDPTDPTPTDPTDPTTWDWGS